MNTEPKPGIYSPGDPTAQTDPRSLEPLLRYFQYNHLPAFLQDASKPFYELAERLTVHWTRSPERTVALRKLLESKDAAVRAALDMAEGLLR